MLVGLVIISLGINVIWNLFTKNKHCHIHNHDGKVHTHSHNHNHSITHNQEHSHKHYYKSYAVGLIHGMAGSASLMLLVLATINSYLLGIIYILIFGIGSMIGMTIVGGIISIPFVFTSNKFNLLNKRIRYATGVFSIFFGLFIIYNVGIIQGLII
jgi:ABC-type nickel/cobalt efflux system permease component RcnA